MKNHLISDMAEKFFKMYKEDEYRLFTLVETMELDKIFIVLDEPIIRFSKIYRMKEHEIEKFLNNFELLEYEFYLDI